MQTNLNTENPEQLIYQQAELKITVLGGLRMEGLDRMRVTLKIQAVNRKHPTLQQYAAEREIKNAINQKSTIENQQPAELAVRHSIDLYNETQLHKLVRITAEKLEIGTHSIMGCLNELTNELEKYRLEKIEQQQKNSTPKTRVLTEQEKAAAEQFLRQPNLLQATQQLIEQSGVVGEAQNALLMYLIFTSRKMPRPLHCISFGSSGTGKSHLQEKIGELMPGEDIISITSLSENAFYYFGQQELKNKLILIEDLDGAEGVLYPLRELQSKRSITKTVTVKTAQGTTKTVTLTVEGPVSVAGCTTQESVYEDNANRSFLLYLDESKEQDQKIMQYQKQLAAGRINLAAENAARLTLQNVQRALQPVTIKNPYAEHLELPEEVFKPRRTNAHYLQFIEAITYYHQFQRAPQVAEDTGEIFIETTAEDIAAANELMKEILLRKSDELNRSCRAYFEQLKTYLQQEKKETFSAKEIRQALRINHANQKRYMLMLLQNGYIEKQQTKNKTQTVYQVVNLNEYETLRQRISEVLQKALQAVHCSKPVQSQNEPLAVNNHGALNNVVQKNTKRKPRATKKAAAKHTNQQPTSVPLSEVEGQSLQP